MRQGWSTEAIQDAISDVALASWWLSGEAVNWGITNTKTVGRYLLLARQRMVEQLVQNRLAFSGVLRASARRLRTVAWRICGDQWTRYRCSWAHSSSRSHSP